jgi:hypothetical protein
MLDIYLDPGKGKHNITSELPLLSGITPFIKMYRGVEFCKKYS